MDIITHRFRLACTAIANRLNETRGNDRGEINSNVAWAGAMVVLAVSIAGIVAAKAEGYATGIDFGP